MLQGPAWIHKIAHRIRETLRWIGRFAGRCWVFSFRSAERTLIGGLLANTLGVGDCLPAICLPSRNSLKAGYAVASAKEEASAESGAFGALAERTAQRSALNDCTFLASVSGTSRAEVFSVGGPAVLSLLSLNLSTS